MAAPNVPLRLHWFVDGPQDASFINGLLDHEIPLDIRSAQRESLSSADKPLNAGHSPVDLRQIAAL
jgi:hypothetical protein